MGNKSGKGAATPAVSLTPKQVSQLQRVTSFTEPELQALYQHFLSIAESSKSDGKVEEPTISRRGFHEALGGGEKPSLFVERVFQCFDGNGDGHINFFEFVCGLDILSPETAFEKRLHFSFQVFDLNSDERISKEELRSLLSACFTENDVPVTPGDIKKMVDTTFTTYDLDKDGVLTFAEYKAMAEKNPAFLKPLTLHTKAIIESRLKEAEAVGAGAGGAGGGAGGGGAAAAEGGR